MPSAGFGRIGGLADPKGAVIGVLDQNYGEDNGKQTNSSAHKVHQHTHLNHPRGLGWRGGAPTDLAVP